MAPSAMSALALFSVIFALTAPSVVAADIDVAVLNFALNLEYLEAEFYSWAAYGYGLNASVRGGGPASMGGQKAYLGTLAQKVAETIADDELTHVLLLRAALGKLAVPMPLINIGTAFSTAANAAIGATLSPSFSPYLSDITFLHGAFIFEDVGVTAYKGAAALITSKAYLTVAAGILAVEAYHAGSIRTMLYQQDDQFVFPYGVNVSTIVQAIAALRQTLSGVTDVGVEVLKSDNDFNLVTTDATGGAYSRTTTEVLKIVYFGGKGKGGFYPKGLNGAIK